MKYISLRTFFTVKRLVYSCRWNTWIFFLHLLFLWFVHSWWYSQPLVLVKFLLFWEDKWFFFLYRILCSPSRQVVGVSWQVIFLQWLWFLPYFQCCFYDSLWNYFDFFSRVNFCVENEGKYSWQCPKKAFLVTVTAN